VPSIPLPTIMSKPILVGTRHVKLESSEEACEGRMVRVASKSGSHGKGLGLGFQAAGDVL